MANPVEAYRKLQKKREKEKNRKGRHEAREAAKLIQDPERLKKELDELSHKSIIGRINDDDAERKAKLDKLWEKHTASLAVAAIPSGDTGHSSEDSDSDSSSSDDNSEEEENKCVIQIGGKTIDTDNAKRKVKPEVLPDDFAVELLNNAPPLPEGQQKPKGSLHPQDTRITKRTKVHPSPMIYKPPPKPVVQTPNIQHVPPPPPPPPMQKVEIGLPKQPEKKEEIKSIPLSSYFVPNQLRINQGNGDQLC
ncbi:WW domain binding protein 11, putative [Babesia ovis]|uniref:WW domain binding protein 11, putative n=1 Tax=Babesia ovis TaxID=5869 RepID=A0A9W5TAI2_BABOV|nr:WW domain binding protein 11, putative [Babesia ovis]